MLTRTIYARSVIAMISAVQNSKVIAQYATIEAMQYDLGVVAMSATKDTCDLLHGDLVKNGAIVGHWTI